MPGLSLPVMIGLAMVALIVSFASALGFVSTQTAASDAAANEAAASRLPTSDQFIYGKR